MFAALPPPGMFVVFRKSLPFRSPMLLVRRCRQNVPPGINTAHASHNDFHTPQARPDPTQSPYLGEGAHGQQGVRCDGVVPQVGGGVEGLDAAHLPLGAAKQTA